MTASDIWPGLRARESKLLCRDLQHRDDTIGRYRVPIEHRPLKGYFPNDAASVATALSDPATKDLGTVLEETGGLALFAPAAWPLPAAKPGKPFEPTTTREQSACGSIIVWPCSEWARLRKEFADWQYNGGVDAAFTGLAYGFADIVIFASINFSPDCWFLVTRGPMAGRVYWWTHDGDSQTRDPWAESIAAWGERVWRETPEVFGGVIRFDASASPDDVPEGAELYPTTLVVR
jgi:hypothetical protein